MKLKNKKNIILIHQQQELNSSVLYEKIAQKTKNEKERETLLPSQMTSADMRRLF